MILRFRRAVGYGQAFYAHDVVQPLVQVAAKLAPLPDVNPNGLPGIIRHCVFALASALTILAKYLVVVVDQEPWVNLPAGHLTKLLLDEIQCGMGGDAKAHDLAGFQMHDDEDVDDLKVGQVLLKKVAAKDALLMFREKSPPLLARVGSPIPGDVLGNGLGGMVDAQLEAHFIGDVLSAPGGIVPGDAADDGDIFFWNGRAASFPGFGARLALSLPEILEKVVVPAFDGPRQKNMQSLFPSTPKFGHENPEQAIDGSGGMPFAAQPFQFVFEHLNLGTEGSVLQAQIGRRLETGPEDCSQCGQTADQVPKGLEGHREASQGAVKIRETILHKSMKSGAQKPSKCSLKMNKWGSKTGKNGWPPSPRPARVNSKKPLQNRLGYIYWGAWEDHPGAKTGGPPPDVQASSSQPQRTAA